MDEVDSIIFHFLSQLDMDLPDNIKNLGDMPLELTIKSVSKCLNTINPALNVPRALPQGVSHRIEVAAQIASICKDLGYKNDVGYQTFLYCNESDLRQVFMFLIEHLPCEGKNIISTPSSVKSVFLQNISKKINEELHSIWIPPRCHLNSGNIRKDCLTGNFHLNIHQINEKDLLNKLLQIKDTSLKEAEKAEPAQNTPNTIDSDDEINHSLKDLKETAIVLRQRLNALESERNIMNFEYGQLQKSGEIADGELKNVLNILNSIGLDNTHINSDVDVLDRVQRDIQALHIQSEELTSKQLSIKLEIEKHKNKNTNNDSERSKCRKTLISLKETAKALKEEHCNKEHLRDQSRKSVGNSRATNKRSIYTKRILEIITNVDKQNLEIKKVLDDTRELQKEINSLEGQLDRCFSIADETLFGDAKKDDQAKKAYKLLALLHSECNTIVGLINDTGTMAREIIDLEDYIKAEKTKRTEDTLEKIQLDLAKMRDEEFNVN